MNSKEKMSSVYEAVSKHMDFLSPVVAMEVANDSEFGLSSSVFTKETNMVHRFPVVK